MKESTNELNATVVVVLAIAVLIAFFYYTIWPILRENFENNSQCSKSICLTEPDANGYVLCHNKNDKVNCKTEPDKCFLCVYKG